MFKPLSAAADEVVRDLERRLTDCEQQLKAANRIIADNNCAFSRMHGIWLAIDPNEEDAVTRINRARSEALAFILRGANK